MENLLVEADQFILLDGSVGYSLVVSWQESDYLCEVVRVGRHAVEQYRSGRASRSNPITIPVDRDGVWTVTAYFVDEAGRAGPASTASCRPVFAVSCPCHNEPQDIAAGSRPAYVTLFADPLPPIVRELEVRFLRSPFGEAAPTGTITPDDWDSGRRVQAGVLCARKFDRKSGGAGARRLPAACCPAVIACSGGACRPSARTGPLRTSAR